MKTFYVLLSFSHLVIAKCQSFDLNVERVLSYSIYLAQTLHRLLPDTKHNTFIVGVYVLMKWYGMQRFENYERILKLQTSSLRMGR